MLLSGWTGLAIFLIAFEASAGEAWQAAIDEQIKAGCRTRQITAAERSSDEEFLRRIWLDLAGTIPSAAETRAFLEDPDEHKRERMIDHLLNAPAFASHMAQVFDAYLMERRPDANVSSAEWRKFLRTAFAENRPLDQLIAEILAADGSDSASRGAARFYLDRLADCDTLVCDVGRILLGMSLECARCHDHPVIDDYHHADYHGLSVFFKGMGIFREKKTKASPAILEERVVSEVSFASVFDTATTHTIGPRLPDGRSIEVPRFEAGQEYLTPPGKGVRGVPRFSLREVLARELPSAASPAFVRNMANRLWAHMLGRGLVHPLEMHHPGNPPSHLELLDLLSERLVALKFDIKAFLREIALTETYQRSSSVPEGVDADSLPVEAFAVASLKPLSPEQLFACLLAGTGGNVAPHAPLDSDVAAQQSNTSESGTPPKAARKPASEQAKQLQAFVDQFAAPPGQAEGEFQASLGQALFLANSSLVAGYVQPHPGNLASRLVALDDPHAIADELYLSLLVRLPKPEERAEVAALLREAASRETAVVRLVWTLVASAEFRFNH